MRETELYLDKHATGAEQRVDQSLTMLSPPGIRADLNVQHASYFPKGDRINMMTSQYENSLFSSSLSELFSRRMRLTSNEAVYGHSVDTVTSRGEEEPFESLEEMEAQTIGNLLPDDDDLLSGMTNDYNVNLNGGNYLDELDLFSSVGGMDLGNEGSSDVQRTPEFPRASPSDLLGVCNGSEAGKHGYGLKPSRTLAVRNINSNVEDSAIRAIFEQYGDIHTLYTVYRNHGFVMISYYDIRAAQNAMQALQSKPLRDKKLDIHYSDPKDNISCTDVNQATLNVVLLDSSVSNDELHRKFGVFGEIKEISDIPHNSNHKFIEYYDVRDAVAALQALNRGDTAGKHIKVEPGHPQW